jgi:hypothetical protein
MHLCLKGLSHVVSLLKNFLVDKVGCNEVAHFIISVATFCESSAPSKSQTRVWKTLDSATDSKNSWSVGSRSTAWKGSPGCQTSATWTSARVVSAQRTSSTSSRVTFNFNFLETRNVAQVFCSPAKICLSRILNKIKTKTRNCLNFIIRLWKRDHVDQGWPTRVPRRLLQWPGQPLICAEYTFSTGSKNFILKALFGLPRYF